MPSPTEQAFSGDASSAASARAFAKDSVDALVPAPVPATLYDDVELIVSELVTNAIRADSPTVRVALERVGGRLAIRVSDEATGWPEQRSAGVHDTGGRGLPLVSALSSSWGVTMAATGKVVWAELELPGLPTVHSGLLSSGQSAPTPGRQGWVLSHPRGGLMTAHTIDRTSGADPALSPAQLAALHAQLEELRDFRIEQLAELERTRHHAGLGSAAREITATLQTGARAALHDVQVALWQLDEGDYGFCAVCGVALNPDQLRSVPQALRCASCREAER